MNGTASRQYGTFPTANDDLWLWDDVFHNDCLPFFDSEPAPQLKYQNNFDTLDIKRATTIGGTQVLPEHAKAQKLEPG